MKPRIFISSVSSELASAREEIAKVLRRLGYEPESQETFGLEAGKLKAVLRRKIDRCGGLIHFVGHGYGAEPCEPDSEFGRVSYTQYEFLYAQKRQKKTWVLFAEEGCSRDLPLDQLDLPKSEDQPDAAAYQAERRDLQAKWRTRLRSEGHIRYAVESDDQLKLKINELNEDFTRIWKEFRRRQNLLLLAAAVGALLLGVVIAGQSRLNYGLEEIKSNLVVSPDKLRYVKIEESQEFLNRELAKANLEPDFDKRERLKEEAKASHELRLVRIQDAWQSDAVVSEDLEEMLRILETEKVNRTEKALSFAGKGREPRFERVRARRLAEQELSQQELRIDLESAALAVAKGELAQARELYDEILQLEPDWPEAVSAGVWFFRDRAWHTMNHGDLRDAQLDAQRCLNLAERLYSSSPENPQSQRLLAAGHSIYGDVLLNRGQSGDSEQALKHFTKSMELRRELLKVTSDTGEDARELTMSLDRLGDFLARHGKSGDLEQSLKFLTQSLELRQKRLLKDSDSPAAKRDLTMSFDRLGDVLTRRSQIGDVDQALVHFTESLKLREELLQRDPRSADAMRNVTVSLHRAGALLWQRRNSGDAELALKYLTRSLSLREQLLEQTPHSVQAMRDLAANLDGLGEFLAHRKQRGDSNLAIEHFQRSLKLREAAVRLNPESAEVARDVAVSLNNLGGHLWLRGQVGDAEQALKHLTRCLELSEDRLKKNPDSAQAQRDVTVSLERLGDILTQRGQSDDLDQALKYILRCLEMRKNRLKIDADSAEAARDVMVSHHNLGQLQAKLEQYDAAIQNFQSGIEILDRMLAKGLYVEQSKRDKTQLENTIAAYRVKAMIWKALLKAAPKQ